MMDISILDSKENLPWDLLLLADPSRKMINKYINDSVVLVSKVKDQTLGVLVLRIDQSISEIMNVAVAEDSRGKGIGTSLIKHAIEYSRSKNLDKVLIGTADTSQNQLTLYEHIGFISIGRIDNFFTENYRDPIYENGKQARDMIRLEMKLS